MSDERPHVLIVSDTFDPDEPTECFEVEHHDNCPTEEHDADIECGSYTTYTCLVDQLVHWGGLEMWFRHSADPDTDGSRKALSPGRHLIQAWTEHTPANWMHGEEWDAGLTLVEPERQNTEA